MFGLTELSRKNRQLKKENMKLREENKANREDIRDLKSQKLHAKLFAQYTVVELLELEKIDRSGISEKSKAQRRNVIVNELRGKSIDLIKELSSN